MSNFMFQENQYGGALLPCTLADFNRIVDSEDVSWRISMRREVEKAVREGLSLDSFVADGKFQSFCEKHAAEADFQSLSEAEKLLRWTNALKMGLPCFIFAAKAFKGNQRKLEDVVLGKLFMIDFDHLPCNPREIFARTQAEGFPWQTPLAYITSSGDGLRLVGVSRPELGNIADNQICLARDLGILDLMGTTGKPVLDDSCIDATRISYAPCRGDILFMNEKLLFGTEGEVEDEAQMETLYGGAYRMGRGSCNPIHSENRFHEDNAVVTPTSATEVTVSQQTPSTQELPLVFGHQVLDFVNVLLPNGVPQGSRHKTGISLAYDLIILRDGNVDAVRQDMLQLAFIQEIIRERGQKEIESILQAAKKLMEKREQEYISSPQPSVGMRRAIESLTGRSYSSLVAEQNKQMLGGQPTPEKDLLQFLNSLGADIKKLMPRFPLLELFCHNLPRKHYIAALFIGGAYSMTLMTRCWYRFWPKPGRKCRLNNILELIGRMGSGKHILVDFYRIMMTPIKKTDQAQIDALNKWNMEHEQKNGSAKNSSARPTGIYRCLPAESSAAAIRDAMFFNKEDIDGEPWQLHVTITDSELDNTLTQMKKDYMNISSLHLKGFHNEPQGSFLKTTTACVGEVDVVANFMYSGTEYALAKQVTTDNFGSGLPSRLTVVPMGDSNFEMMKNRAYTPEDERRDNLLLQWAYKLDKTCGEIPAKEISDALHKWTSQRMDEARENKSRAEEDLLKRPCWHAINYSLPFIVSRHWDQMKQDENGYWRCNETFSTDRYDLQLALLIAKAQLSFQHYFFKGIAEEYYRKIESSQLAGKKLQSHTAIAYKNLPSVFTREDIDRCYGYEGNKNSINSCIKRLQDDGKVQRIRAGNDKGKYRKLE
ncbi:MAG: hypothetical protein IKP91_00720 [Bacteroidaceae bacterium]|nr:hypothetical protein [Bacteroidaceae bacterium]